MILSTPAKRFLQQMQKAEGNFIALSACRSNNNAMDELQDEQLAIPGSLHSNNGFVLTQKGKNYVAEPQPSAEQRQGKSR